MALLRLEGVLLLLFLVIRYTDTTPCVCDLLTTYSTLNCSYALDQNNQTVNLTGCTCLNSTGTLLINASLTPVMYCAFIPTTTPVSTTPSGTNCTDANNNGVCDYIEYASSLRCYNQTLSSTMDNYGLIFGSAWIIIWCVLSIIINIAHKNKSHHRWIHLYEELGIIVLVICIGILNFAFDTHSQETACKIVAIASHFFMVLVAAALFFEATFAESMVHGKPKKNGCLPAVLNYILPIVLAAIPTGLTYYFQKDNYGTTLLHCFAVLTQDMMWGFIIPVWILICAATLQSQLACLACDMTTKEQDQAQCFWAKKSSKSLTLVALLLLSIWLLIMHAGDEQFFYLFILSIVLMVIFGPVLFVAHTFCHINTCRKWGRPTGLKKMYSLCPEKPKDKEIVYEEKIVYVDRHVPAANGPANNPQNNAGSNNPNNPPTNPRPVGDSHTQAQQFYSWLFDKNKKQSDPTDILFKPKPY